MTVLLTGWSVPTVAASRGWSWSDQTGAGHPRHPSAEVSFSLEREEGTVRLTVAAPDLVVRKTVRPEGRTEVTIDCAGDALSILATPATIVVARGDHSVMVNVNGGHDEQLARVRGLLVGSAAERAVRLLATVLEESGTDAPEKMGIRLTGTLLAQMDGDDGAVRRLSRGLQGRYAPSLRRARLARPERWDTYQAGVTKAAADLETCLESFFFFNPMRQVCSFIWVHQVECLWRAYVSGFPAPRP